MVDILNNQIKNVSDGTEMNDASTMEQSSTMYDNGVLVMKKPPYVSKVNTNGSGQAVFYLTDTGLVGGVALFNTIKNVSINVNIGNAAIQKSYTVSGDLKTLTVSLTQQTFTSTNVLLTLLGAVTGAFTNVSYPAAGSGIAVELRVEGI